MDFLSSYNLEAWEQTVWINGKKYVYKGVSPYNNRKFWTIARYNRGRAMAYIRDFTQKDPE